MSTLREKMLSVMADLNAEVVEREELIETIAIALLTRKNLFILGDPGQAKSFVINGFRRRITGAQQFERLLSKQADEEQLFGRVDLSSLIPGQVPQWPTMLRFRCSGRRGSFSREPRGTATRVSNFVRSA